MHRGISGHSRRPTAEYSTSRHRRQSALAAAGIVAMGALAHPLSAAETGVYQTYFVPLPEQMISDFNSDIRSQSVSNDIRTVLSISVVLDGTRIWYDQHEDGLETFLTIPTQATTGVWGDGDPSNGFAPGYPSDVLQAGDVIVLDQTYDVTTPGTCSYTDASGSDCRLSGGDRFGSNKALAVTRAAWNTTPGSVLAGATEVDAVANWSQDYLLPLGQDTATSKDKGFQTVWAMVSASEADTEVSLNGATPVVLQAGQTHAFSGIQEGDSLNASAPIQVNLLTGTDASYESRWFRVPPREQWAAEYYSPVGTTDTGSPAHYYLFNPGNAMVEVEVEYSAGNFASVMLPAGGGAEFTNADTSGLYFRSTGGEPYYIMGSVDASGNSSTHDWGFSLVAASTLTGQTVLGWAPGDEALNNANYSPVWITAVDDTTLCVDYDRDGTIDVTQAVNRLDMVRLIDSSDNDMTGALIYSINNGAGTCDTSVANADQTDLAVTWGQDPQFATSGSPALDLGTTVLGVPNYAVSKRAELLVDADSSGHITPGDTLRFIIEVDNYGALPLNNAMLTDTMPTVLQFDAGNSNPGWDCSNFPDCQLGTFSVAPFTSVSYDLAARIPAEGNTAAVIENTVTLNPGGGLEESSSSATAGVEYADVTVELDLPSTALPGGAVTGYVRFGNVGAVDAADIGYVLRLPEGLAGISCDGATCHYNPATGVVTVSGLPTALSPGQWTGDIALRLIAPAAGQVPVRAEVSTSSLQPSPHATDVEDAALNVVATSNEVDVISRVDPPATAAPGSTVTVPVTFANLGPTTANGLGYELTMPPGLTNVNCSTGITCSYNTTTGVVSLGGLPASLAAGEEAGFNLSYTAPASGPVTVSSSITTGSAESVTANNPDQGQTAISTDVVADVSTSVAPLPQATVGAHVTVPVRYINVGANDAAGVTYTLELSTGADDIAVSYGGTACSYNAASGAVSGCGLPTTLVPGQAVELDVSYEVATAGSIEVISRVATSSTETFLLNNLASAETRALGTDLAISLAGLAGLQINQPFNGHFTCTNVGEVDALADTRCGLTGLPNGLQVEGCSLGGAEWHPGDAIPAGAAVQCAVSGQVGELGELTVEGITGALGDINPANDTDSHWTRLAVVAPVPTLGTWALLCLALLIGAAGRLGFRHAAPTGRG